MNDRFEITPMTTMSLTLRLYRIFLFGLVMATMLIDSSDSFAFISSKVSLQRLVSQSEIVLKGQIISIDGPAIGEKTALIKVDAVFKGDWVEQPLYFTVPSMPLQLINILQPKEYAIFFLKKVEGKVVPSDPFHIMVPIREGRLPAVDAKGALAEVRQEMVFTAKGTSKISEESSYKHNIVVEGARKFNRPDLVNELRPFPMNVTAVKHLAESGYNEYGEVIPNDDDVTKALRDLLPTPDVLLRGALFATLLTRGQFDMLEPAVRYINDKERNSTVQNRAQVAAITNDVAKAISHVRDRKYVRILGPLLQHPNRTVRDAAFTALRSTSHEVIVFVNRHRQEDAPRPGVEEQKEIEALRSQLVPWFVIALDDEDENISYWAAETLAGILGGIPFPSPFQDGMDENAQRAARRELTVQWKGWWENEGRKEFESVP